MKRRSTGSTRCSLQVSESVDRPELRSGNRRQVRCPVTNDKQSDKKPVFRYVLLRYEDLSLYRLLCVSKGRVIRLSILDSDKVRREQADALDSPVGSPWDGRNRSSNVVVVRVDAVRIQTLGSVLSPVPDIRRRDECPGSLGMRIEDVGREVRTSLENAPRAFVYLQVRTVCAHYVSRYVETLEGIHQVVKLVRYVKDYFGSVVNRIDNYPVRVDDGSEFHLSPALCRSQRSRALYYGSSGSKRDIR